MRRDVIQRVNGLEWSRLAAELDASGNAQVEHVLSADECREIVALYEEENPFRSRVVMGRHGFGRGEY